MRMRTLLGPLAILGAVAIARRRSRPGSRPGSRPLDRPLDLWADPAPTVDPPLPVTTVRSGDRSARGTGGTVQMDLDRAVAARVEPVVQFLTYVQQRRGDRHHLLFVRTDDLDAMAEAADEPIDDFLSRLDQLGVVVSHN